MEATKGTVESVRLLLDRGADIDNRDNVRLFLYSISYFISVIILTLSRMDSPRYLLLVGKHARTLPSFSWTVALTCRMQR